MRTFGILLVCATALFAAACDQLQQVVGPQEYNGASLIVEVDAAAAVERDLESISERMANALRESGISYSGRGAGEGAARIRLADASESPRALETLASLTSNMTLTAQPDGLIEARYTEEYLSQQAEALTVATIPILERRLAPVRASVAAHEAGRLIIRTNDPNIGGSVRWIISQEGRVTFNMVREVSPDRVSAGLLPPRSQLAQPYFQGTFAEVVDSRPSFTGENIANVSPSTDVHTGEFVLSFELDDEGKRIFCRITRDHVGERFAVLLDGKVLTAPRINEAICGGTGQISGNFTAESANELAIMMRAGALPAPLRIIEERAPDASAP